MKQSGPVFKSLSPRVTWLALVLLLALGAATLPAAAQPLYEEHGAMTSLFADPPRARAVGDMVTIKVKESMTAIKVDGLTNDRGLTTAASSGTGIASFIGKILGSSGVSLGGRQQERSDRSDSLITVVPTQVVEVLPNGYLQVEGQRDFRVNADRLAMSLTGTVRPRDLNRDNEVDSTRVTDLQMLVKRKNQRGIFDTLFRLLF